MTPEREFDRVLEAWFREGASTMPERLFETVFDRVDRVPQRRLARLKFRFTDMTRLTSVAAAAAVIIVVAIIGIAVVSRPSTVGAPTPAPTQAAVPSEPAPTSAACLPGAGCGTVLSAGQHRITLQSSIVSYTVPDGWAGEDRSDWFFLERAVDNAAESDLRSWNLGPTAYVFANPRLVEANASCIVATKGGVAPSATALGAWLAGRPGLVASKPQAVTIGGLQGQLVDVRVDPKTATSCPQLDRNGDRMSQAVPYVPVVANASGGSATSWEFGPVQPNVQRYIFVQLGSGSWAAIVIDAGPTAFDTFAGEAMPIIGTMTFSP